MVAGICMYVWSGMSRASLRRTTISMSWVSAMTLRVTDC
jgi:hypothetical protein